MQQRDDQGDEQAGQDRVRHEDFTKQKHSCGSEPLGPQQRVGEVEKKAERDEAGERIIEDHGALRYSRSQV